MKKVVFGGCCLLVVSCSPTPPPRADVHYTVGAAWQADGQWFYPREEFALQGTGLAVRQNGREGELTANGEVRSMATMTARYSTLNTGKPRLVKNRLPVCSRRIVLKRTAIIR